MYSASGAGLAANQVGLPFRLFVMNVSGDKEIKDDEYVFINPVILKKNGNALDDEGCLSFPDIHADVVRSEVIEVESIALSGDVLYFKWKDRPARIVQHELDHLNGVGFIDHLSATVKREIRSELDDMLAVFEGNQRLGFGTLDADQQRWDDYERRFC
jgi:peptide deformylase